MSAFEARSVQRVLDLAGELGVSVPFELKDIFHGGSHPAREWAQQHPDERREPCCYGSANDPADCTCWLPVYDHEQAPMRPPRSPEEIRVRSAMCGDCAYRKRSAERAHGWQEEMLLFLAQEGEPFWCHDGMRKPDRWEHPDGRVVPGHPDDWQPPDIAGIPFRLDGSPGLLCAGWAARAAGAAAAGAVKP